MDMQGGKEKDALEMWDPDSHFNELNSELQHFIDDLPEAFRYTEVNVQFQTAERTLPQFVFVHISYHQVRLFLRRSTLSTVQSSSKSAMPAEFANLAREIALDAATNIATILHDAQERGVSIFAPFTGYCAFNASLVHLVRMFHPHKAVQLEAKKHMETCLKFLLQLKQYWGLFRSITEQLKTLYRTFQVSYSHGSTGDGHAEVARMLQYGDWFTKYPQGFPPGEFEEYTVKAPSDDAALSHRPDLQTADEFFARLGPRLDTRQTKSLPPPIKHPQPFMQSSPDTRNSSVSVGHVHSPMVPSNNPIQQSPGLHAPPITMNTPSMVQSPVDLPPKIDTQTAHARQASMPQQSPSYGGGFVQQNTASQMASPLSARLSNMPTSSQFSSYPPQVMTPHNPTAQSSSPSGFNHRPQQHPVSQEPQTSQPPYLYDTYTSGSDTSLIAALSNSLWQGFDQPISTADVCAFPENQTSSAWFMPFNSVPHQFETEHSDLDPLGMLAGGGAGSGGAGGVGVGGGGLPSAEGGRSLSSTVTGVGGRNNAAVAGGIGPGGHPGAGSGYHRSQPQQSQQQQR
jgi:hypothetical protein